MIDLTRIQMPAHDGRRHLSCFDETGFRASPPAHVAGHHVACPVAWLDSLLTAK